MVLAISGCLLLLMLAFPPMVGRFKNAKFSKTEYLGHFYIFNKDYSEIPYDRKSWRLTGTDIDTTRLFIQIFGLTLITLIIALLLKQFEKEILNFLAAQKSAQHKIFRFNRKQGNIKEKEAETTSNSRAERIAKKLAAVDSYYDSNKNHSNQDIDKATPKNSQASEKTVESLPDLFKEN